MVEPSMKDRIDAIRARISDAERRSGRDDGSVALIGVSKFQPVEAIYEALSCGVRVLGENRVQERAQKAEVWSGPEAEWHLIGHLQRNKARRAVELFSMVQSVDSPALLDAIARIATELGRAPFKIMIEVNTSGEESKDGVAPEECFSLVERAVSNGAISLEGLMTIGPLDGDERAVRRSFAMLRELAEGARERFGAAMPHLSMGMSGDFEWAIEEGSTMVRVGTSIFGARRI